MTTMETDDGATVLTKALRLVVVLLSDLDRDMPSGLIRRQTWRTASELRLALSRVERKTGVVLFPEPLTRRELSNGNRPTPGT
jgi:hypothetical protein